jgi:hypothetical protein
MQSDEASMRASQNHIYLNLSFFNRHSPLVASSFSLSYADLVMEISVSPSNEALGLSRNAYITSFTYAKFLYSDFK